MVRTAVPSGKRRMVAVACALGVLAGPAAGSAYAGPGPDGGTGADADAGGGPGAGTDAGSASGPGPQASVRLESVRKRIAKLHDRAESATEAYNAAEEKAEKQQKKVAALARKIDKLQGEQAEMNDTAGAMARAQYRSGGMPDGARLFLEGEPGSFLQDAVRVRQGQQAAKGFLARLAGTRSRLEAYAGDASDEWEELEKSRKARAQAKKKITGRLEKAEKLRSRLAKEEREELRRLEEEAAHQRQAAWLKSGILDEIESKGSQAGKRAVAYATHQIGKDYEWGAEGPKTFDCSGLTLRAWQAAGEEIPRTSQEQWKQLPRVPVEDMRPGDLIIFKRDASHVGMYAGDGAMVHAPRTGRQITVEGAGSLPILGVVRPDT